MARDLAREARHGAGDLVDLAKQEDAGEAADNKISQASLYKSKREVERIR
jgi:hypothetical protein